MNTWEVPNHDQHECLFPQEEFRLHFKNISKIMDCVGCFKCRLWGKLQVRFVSSVWELWVLGYQSAQGLPV